MTPLTVGDAVPRGAVDLAERVAQTCAERYGLFSPLKLVRAVQAAGA